MGRGLGTFQTPKQCNISCSTSLTRTSIQTPKPGTLSTGKATLAGALVGMTETVFHTPFETCKIRMQAREFAHCKSSWECAQEMLRAEGALSFYKGFEVRPAI